MNSSEAPQDPVVSWLSQIPPHWVMKKFSHAVLIAEGQVDPEDERYANIMLVAPNHIESGTGRLVASETAVTQGAISGKYLCQKDDVIYSKIRPALRKATLAPWQCLCSADMYPLRAQTGLDPKFLLLLLLSAPFTAWAVLESDRVAMPKINRESLSGLRIPFPPLAEQRAIISYVDCETAQIDALVAAKERVLGLLAEKRRALTTRAVTRGLDPHARVRHSGISWLGEIPAHWERAQLRRFAEFITSGSRGWAEHYSDSGSVFVRIGNLTRHSIRVDLTDVQYVEPPLGAEGERTRIQPGDLLFSITAYLGSIAVAPPDLEDAYVNQHIALVRLEASRGLLPEFVGYASLSDLGQSQLSGQGYGGTKTQLALEDIGELWFPVPPLAEQQAIINHLSSRIAKLEALHSLTERTIALLKERRAALIAAAVTGQIDVRVSR